MTGTVVAALPFYPDNPWQDLVYGGLAARGAHVVGIGPFFDEDGLRVQLDGALPDVLHVGWTTPIAQVVPDVATAHERVRTFLATVAAVQRAGTRVVWTVHNVLPHEMPHVTPELALHRGLALLSDVVHVMNPRTPALTAGLYDLPSDRTVVVPHPSYRGRIAPLSRSGREARRGPVTLLLFGALRPYKGVLEFAAEVAALRDTGVDVRLVVAGRVGGSWTEDVLHAALAPFGDAVEARLGFVDDDAVPALFAGADALVLPYATGLNSGAMMLAATVGTPVLVGPGLRASVELDPGWQIPLWADHDTGAADGTRVPDGTPALDATRTADGTRTGDGTGAPDAATILQAALDRLRTEGDALGRRATAVADDLAPERIQRRFATLLLGR
jgi:glycosyltransferase involved in cell wall biosynthesis